MGVQRTRFAAAQLDAGEGREDIRSRRRASQLMPGNRPTLGRTGAASLILSLSRGAQPLPPTLVYEVMLELGDELRAIVFLLVQASRGETF